MLLGSRTSKPSLAYSNASWIDGLNMGKLTKKVRKEKTSLLPVRLGLRNMQIYGTDLPEFRQIDIVCVEQGTYQNREGVRKFVGTPDLQKTASEP